MNSTKSKRRNNIIKKLEASCITILMILTALTTTVISITPTTIASEPCNCDPPCDLDFGDAPSPFPTLLADNGARHIITPGFWLGPTIDAEINGQPDPNALGDDMTNIDDEDGVTLPVTAMVNTTVNYQVYVTSPPTGGVLDAWIDFNADGDWDDNFPSGSERILNHYQVTPGTNQLSFYVPKESLPYETVYVRFRLSATGVDSYTGCACNGEVEDYQVYIYYEEPPLTYIPKWEQPPINLVTTDLFNGWNEQSIYGYSQIVADDWFCDTDQPVTDLHWWGSYQGYHQEIPPPSQNLVSFHVGVWTDVPAGVDTPYSHPGQMIWGWVIPRQVLNEHFFGWDMLQEAVFQYDYLIPENEWFYQGPGQNIYWLSISAVYTPSVDDWLWGWLTRPYQYYDAAIDIYSPTSPTGGSQFLSGLPIDPQYAEVPFKADMCFNITTYQCEDVPPNYWRNFEPNCCWNESQTPDTSIEVKDIGMGLDVSTAEYSYSTDGGLTWNPWTPCACTGVDFSNNFETISADDVPFNQDTINDNNQIKFRIKDMCGNTGESPAYVILIDTTHPWVYVELGEPKILEFEGSQGSLPMIGSNTPVWINATDNSSGIYALWYSTQGPSNWMIVYDDDQDGLISVKLTFNDYNCHHQIDYRAVDNCEIWFPQPPYYFMGEDFYVDISGPTTSTKIMPPNIPIPGTPYSWMGECTYKWINITDSGCEGGAGVQKAIIKVYIGQSSSGPWGTPIAVYEIYDNQDTGEYIDLNPTIGEISVKFHFTEDCWHMVEHWGVDKVGNIETYVVAKNKQIHMVDATPPETYLTYNGNYCIEDENEICVNNNTVITINTNNVGTEPCIYPEYYTFFRVYVPGVGWYPDPVTGLGDYGTYTASDPRESWKGVYWYKYTKTFSFAEECVHYLEFFAKDPLCNTEGTHNITHYVDNQAPQIIKSVGEPSYQISGTDNYCVTQETVITLSAVDPGCCPCEDFTFEYRTWYDGIWTEWMPYIDGISFEEDCMHYLEVRAYDCLGNQALDNETFYVDSSAPEITKTVGDPKHQIPGTNNYCITTDTEITLSATDIGCCQCDVTIEYGYEYDGVWSGWMPYTEPFNFDEECVHILYVQAYDCLGNGMDDAYWDIETFYVDDTPPVIYKFVGQPSHMIPDTDDYCVTTGTIITVVIDDESCCQCDSTIEYRIWYDDVWTEWMPYVDGISFEEECEHVLEIRVTDCLGNQIVDNETFYVDDSAPVIIKTVGDPKCLLPGSSDLQNPGFETGDFTGWTIEAAYDSVTVVTADDFTSPYAGTYMARLADYNGGEGGSQPIGDNKISQVFTVTQDTFAFAYNMFTYDYSPFDNFAYSLKTADGLTTIAEYSQTSWGTSDDWGLKSTGWQVVTIDVSSYVGQQLKFEITCGGTADNEGSAWAYVDCSGGDTDNYCITTDTEITVTATDQGCCPGCEVTVEYRYYYNGEWSGWMLYDGPISFGEQCEHILQIRAYDCLGNGMDDAYWDTETFYVDESAPEIYKEVGQPSNQLPDIDDYCVTTDTEITITAEDLSCGDCGPVTIEYGYWYDDVWSGWMLYTGPFSFDEECEHILYIRAYDCLGNGMDEQYWDIETFYVDDTPPQITKTVGQPNCPIPGTDDYCITTETEITVSAEDFGCCPGCDVAIDYRYYYDGEWSDWMLYDGPISFEGECEHILEVKATDCLGNEIIDSETFYVDESAPEITKTVGEPKYQIPGTPDYCITTDTEITITAEDLSCGDCGPVTIEYGYWYDDVWSGWMLYTGPFSFDEECEHILYIRAYDCLGNGMDEQYWDIETFYVDETPPMIYKFVGQPSHMIPDTDDYCVTTNTWITVEIQDESCCQCDATIDYRIWYDGVWTQWMPYVEGISFDEECMHYLEIRASDCLGNYVIDNETFYVDDTPPQITKTVGQPNCPIPDTDDYCVTTDTEITVTATDEGCCPGCDAILEYRIWYNNEWSDWMLYDGPISFEGECEHILEIRATDCLGNQIVDSETFYVDETPPELVKTVGDPHFYMGVDEYGHDVWMIYPGTNICFTVDEYGCCQSGEATILYRYWYLGQWTEWTTYTDCITLTEGCVHYLEAKAFDCLGNGGDVIDNETFWVCAPGGGGSADPNIEITFPEQGSTQSDDAVEVIIHAYDDETSWEDLNVFLWVPGGRRDAPYLYYEVTPIEGQEDYYHAFVPIFNYQDGAMITLDAIALDEDGNTGAAVPVTFKVHSTIVWDQWMQYGWNPLPLNGGMPPDFGCNDSIERVMNSVNGSYDWVFHYDLVEGWTSYYTEREINELTTIEGGKSYWVHIFNESGLRYYIGIGEIEILYPEDGALLFDLNEINGTTWNSETGMEEVHIQIYYKDESNTKHYWDGSAWVMGAVYLPCDLELGYIQNWSYDSSSVAWIPGETFYAKAGAMDKFGCYAYDMVSFEFEEACICAPSIDLEKYVWDGEGWANETDIFVGQNATFNLSINNDGETIGGNGNGPGPGGPTVNETILQAIEDGIAWLVTQQNQDGSWGDWYPAAETGFALIKLQDYAYESGYESPFDPDYQYSSNVTSGWTYLLNNAQKETLSVQSHGNPDTNGNGYGLYWGSYDQSYQTGICSMALEASRTPSRVNDAGKDFNLDGNPDTYIEIVQDVADWLAYGQIDDGTYRGGWGYEANEGWADNSVSGYAVLGVAAAEEFGCTIPSFVKPELNYWIDYIQCHSAGDTYGGSGYGSPCDWVNLLKTGNLIFEMKFYGDTPSVPRFSDAMNYIENHWHDVGFDQGWGYQGGTPAHYQSMYCLMKGLQYSGIDLLDLNGDAIPEHDWYKEFADVLVAQQNVDGSWPDSAAYYSGGWGYSYVGQRISTAWALQILEKITPKLTPECPSCDLTDWYINDTLPEGLEYVENSAKITVISCDGYYQSSGPEVQPQAITVNPDGTTTLEWWETGSEPFNLTLCTKMYIEFNATVLDCEAPDGHINTAYITAYSPDDESWVSDEDTAEVWVNCEFDLSGTIYYNGESYGDVWVFLSDHILYQPDGAPIDYQIITEESQGRPIVGTYEFTDLEDGTYYVAAFMDNNDSSTYDVWEPLGFAINETDWDSTPIIISGINQIGNDITLHDPFPDVDLDKTVWRGEMSAWDDYTEVLNGETVTFNITILNKGLVAPLIFDNITDYLPTGLDYVEGSGKITVNTYGYIISADVDPIQEPIVEGTKLIWGDSGMMVLPNNELYLTFNATVTSCPEQDNYINLAEIYSWYGNLLVYDSDTAEVWVNCEFDLSGTIYYDEYIDEGELIVTLFDEKPVTPDITPIDVIGTDLPVGFPFDYTFYNLAPGTYYVAAQIDTDDSGGPPGPGEPDGYAINETSVDDMDPIVITYSDVYDVDVTLLVPIS